jgi:hypothetical protein
VEVGRLYEDVSPDWGREESESLTREGIDLVTIDVLHVRLSHLRLCRICVPTCLRRLLPSPAKYEKDNEKDEQASTYRD